MFSDEDKLACLQRELTMRRRLYPHRVRNGLMAQPEADREIALIEAIMADYRAKVQPELALGGLDGTPPRS
jgi:hypothetical protein